MECTQRLECTQELFTQAQRECPEQIGFLGICGNKYPVKKGPNKIGRDPQTCNIVLNLNSVSRQHAVINILNNKDFMLMDLDSANKTKLLGKNLIPYVPQPLKNGDMVQFGEVFGIFRLLEEEDELPMTQAINIPETPVSTRHISKLNAATTVPESPDVSDKDDSFIIASQLKGPHFKSSNTHFIKPGKTISIQPVGGHKIDNIYWNSSKKSTSINLDESISSLNDSTPFVKLCEKENEANASNIHEMDTQALVPPKVIESSIHEANTQAFIPPNVKECTYSIHEANTQLPESPIPSIYTANTQLPEGSTSPPLIYTANTQVPDPYHSPSIHSLETQLPPGENLPDVCKINEQQDMQLDIRAHKDISICNDDNEMFPPEKHSPVRVKNISGSPFSRTSNEHSKFDKSVDKVLLDEIDGDSVEENFESQDILTDDVLWPFNRCVETESEPLSQIVLPKSTKRNMRIQSDSSTDCDDIDDQILPTQKVPVKETKIDEMDSTDCEDEMIELKSDKNTCNLPNISGVIDLDDVATQVIEVIESPPAQNVDIENMLTQVINVNFNAKTDAHDKDNIKILDIGDLPTQVLVEDLPMKTTNVHKRSDEVDISPFKIPLNSAFKAKKKDSSKTPKIKTAAKIECERAIIVDNKYYQDTQEIYEDLCTQIIPSPEMPRSTKKTPQDAQNDNERSPRLNTSLSDSDVEDKINNFVSTLSSQDIRDVIGAEKVVPLSRNTSDTSDLELTPKKNRPIKFMDIDLPNSQEIKTSVSLNSKSIVTESSSESEPENNSEDQCTPILFRKKKKTKRDAKIDLSHKFDFQSLPTRVLTRVRKPTAKVQETESKKITESILKPKFLTDQDDDVNTEIITENITRLKSKNDKCKNAKESSKVSKLDETKLPDENIKSDTNNLTKNLNDTKLNESKKSDPEKKNSPKVIKSSKLKIETKDKDQIKNSCHKSEEKLKEDNYTKKESKRNKSASPPKDLIKRVDKITKPSVEVKTIDTQNVPNAKCEIKTRESRRNYRTLATSKMTDEKRGPIMIEPHIMTAPAKEEKSKKREYKRKNKESDKKSQTLDSIAESKSTDTSKEDVDLTIDTKRPVRSTRGKKKTDETEIDSQKDKRKRSKKQNEPSPQNEIHKEQVVRRSTRQRTAKVKEEKPAAVKSILKRSAVHEQSTVYNLSSGSNTESPSLKRSMAEDVEAPVPKRTRSVANNANLRATPCRTQKTCYVLFTAFPYEDVKMKLEKLGAVVVTDVNQCTVLLTLQIRRTFKLLCAVGLGRPIVGPNWVQACADTGMIVDPWLYTLKDEAAEKRFRFSLIRTLSGKRNFLQGYNLSSTPNVMPAATEMKLIVECSGGTWREGGPQWLCLTCAADRTLWPELRARGATLVTTELILGGVLLQRLDIDANRIKIQ